MGSFVAYAARRQGLIVSGVAVATATGVAAAVIPAVADSGNGGDGQAIVARHGGHAAGGGLFGGGTGRGGTILAASLNGAAEVPVQGGPAVGDKDGAALEFVRIKGDKVSVAVTWRGTDKPSALHIHQGGKGVNGGIKVDFTELIKKYGKGHSLTGTVEVKDAALLKKLRSDPTSFYANLHTAQFPGGAVRGQFHKVTTDFDFRYALRNFQASVLKGKQIYECRKADGGGYAFAQRDVSAVLGGGIAHSFVKPDSGTPQWIAPDRSAVTGALVSKSPNGDRNIPELDLRATQSGKHRGLLANTVEILRLNTVGGVAPAGSCSPGAVVGVPYKADYVFINR